jgi:hypothetical protein
MSKQEPWESKEHYKVHILGFVQEEDWVSFARLHRHFAGDAREDTQLALPGNRVVWAGLPQPIADAVLELLEEGHLAALRSSKAAYKHDGRVLSLPVERRPPPHEEPHWFPVVLRPMAAARAEASEEP